jgi:hypothetical protein
MSHLHIIFFQNLIFPFHHFLSKQRLRHSWTLRVFLSHHTVSQLLEPNSLLFFSQLLSHSCFSTAHSSQQLFQKPHLNQTGPVTAPQRRASPCKPSTYASYNSTSCAALSPLGWFCTSESRIFVSTYFFYRWILTLLKIIGQIKSIILQN